MVSSILNFALRGAQALFGIVVLGLSVTLIRGHHWGNLPASLGFGAFVGGLSLLGALIGFAAVWFDFLGGMVGLVIDGIIALVNVAGGVLFAIKVGGIKCNPSRNDPRNGNKILKNEWLNGGCLEADNGEPFCWNEFRYLKDSQKGIDTYLGHCREAQADFVFMFLTAAVIIVCALMVWMRIRKGY